MSIQHTLRSILSFGFCAMVSFAWAGEIVVTAGFHDQEGFAGMPNVTRTYENPTHPRIEVWFPDSVEPWIDDTRYGAAGDDFPQPAGTPLLFRSSTDQTGAFAGYSALNWHYGGGSIVAYKLPVNGSDLGMYVYETDSGILNQTVCSISYNITESIEQPSLLIDSEVVPGMGSRGVTVMAEYLAGNSNAHLGSQTAFLPNEAQYGGVTIYWPESVSGPNEPYNVNFGTPPPIGLTRISVSIDGYTTHTITLETATDRGYAWASIHKKSQMDAIGPEDITIVNLPAVPPLSLRKRAILWATSGYCDRFSNMTQHMDLTGDAVADVADLVEADILDGTQ